MDKKQKVALWITAIVSVLLLVMATGSYILYISFEEPEVEVISLRVLGIDEDRMGFELELNLEVHNSNGFSLSIEGVDGDILIDGEWIGDIVEENDVNVGSGSSSQLTMILHVDDIDQKIFLGTTLKVQGKVEAKYLGIGGSSPFERSISLFPMWIYDDVVF
ncbi:MAG: LEA type 2 family protein [Thermoplasmata archaeon]|nr:LEA type 2 family protein [Thermoplasmata archaeon]